MRYRAEKHRLPPFKEEGLILIDKPTEWTSFDVVNFFRSRFNVPKVGHCGTLDPAATGLLIIVFGSFTRLSQHLSGQDKTYEAEILIGTETDSQDMDGTITAENDWSSVTPERFREVAAEFIGPQQQIPPMVSAVKRKGKRMYELARKGVEVEREPRDIVIHSLDITRIELPYADFTVKCSKGTYIRTLCADMGTKLGCGAVLNKLRRTSSGPFSIEDAVTIDTLKQWEQQELREYNSEFLHNTLAKMDEFSF